MKEMKKLASSFMAILLVMCFMAGCGAVVSTNMTVDKNFAGKRTIEVRIDKQDLDEKVTGGIDALKSVADSNLPEEMECTVASDESGSTLNFIMAFTDMEDYRQKVLSVIEAGSNDTLVPDIAYENEDTVFKTGVKFKENFTSADLLQWYFDALQTSGIINHSTTSEWYEMGSSTITLDGQTFDTGSELSIDEQELTCLDAIDVHTTVRLDGSYHRAITFTAYDDTVEALAAQGCELKDYLSKLAPENADFEAEDTDSYSTYTISFDAADAQELVQKTDTILQTKNAFSIEIAADEENQGMAFVTLKEKLDGSYYLDYGRYSPLESSITLFDNLAFSSDTPAQNDMASLSDRVLTYEPSANSEYTFAFDWQISFKTVEIIPQVRNAKKADIAFVFTMEASMDAALKSAAAKALEAAADDYGTFSKNGDVCTIKFSGTAESVAAEINHFIKNNVDDPSEEEYFTLSYSDLDTDSKFTTGISGSITYDLSSIIGDTRVLFNDTRGLLTNYYYQGRFSTDDNGNRLAEASDTVSFATVKISLFTVVLMALFVAALITGIVMAICSRNKFAPFFRSLTRKKAVASAEAPLAQSGDACAEESVCQPDTDPEAPVESPSEQSAAVVATRAAAEAHPEEEEVLL